jgi:hypothetical protein
MAKAIRADVFDDFIEEQLQRSGSDEGSFEPGVVCHVY